MNNPNNRATRAIVASGSLLAIIFIAVPWVDEYLELRRGAANLGALESEFVQAQQREKRMDRIEAKLTGELDRLLAHSFDATKTETVREALIEIVRHSGGRLRRLEIAEGETRPWKVENDDPRKQTTQLDGEESRFVLYTQQVELQADGSLESVRQILKNVFDQGWLMTTKGLSVAPTSVRKSPVNLDLHFVLYGLGPNEREPEEDFAKLIPTSELR